MTPLDWIGAGAVAAGAAFFAVGSVGLWRLPDALSRLHALTKIDNLGLGLAALGTGVLAGSAATGGKLAAIWFFAVLSSTTGAHLIARHALARQV